MSDLISKQVLELWNRYKPTIAVDAIEYDGELKKLLGTNLASLGTDTISRQDAIDALRGYLVGKRCPDDGTLTCRLIENEVINKLPPIQPVNNSEMPNSSDVISRQEAIDALMSWVEEHKDNAFGGCLFHWTGIKALLENLPSVEPKRGRWIEDKGQQTLMQNFIEKGEVWRVCSVCGAGHMIGYKYAIDKAYHDRHHNFCPNCGADMRGEQDG